MITRPIASIGDLKEHMPIRAGNITFDVKLAMHLRVATEQIEKYTRRSFTEQVHVETLNARDLRSRVLSLHASSTGT